jgi:hypothetical protein
VEVIQLSLAQVVLQIRMEMLHRHLEFPLQVVVLVELRTKQEATDLLVVAERTTEPMVVQELQDRDLLEENHRLAVEVVAAVVLAKLVTPMARDTVVTVRSAQLLDLHMVVAELVQITRAHWAAQVVAV